MTVELAPRGWHRRGPVHAYLRGADMPKATCSIDGCDSPFYCRGWCVKHYSRWRKNGDPAVRSLQPLGGTLERLWPRVHKTDGCWLWTGSLTHTGYGQITWGPRTAPHKAMVHRRFYELLVGPIPDGMTLDHDCHNADPSCDDVPACLHRRCVRPDHLTPRTMRDNVRQSEHSTGSIHAAKTHCPHGHPYDEANTLVSNGRRNCRACRRRRSQR